MSGITETFLRGLPCLWDAFNYSNGTAIDGLTSPSGFTWADPEHVVTVQDGFMTSTGNCYPAVQNKDGAGVLQPITGVGGSFVFTADPGATGRYGTLIVDNDSPRLQNMLHFIIGASGGELQLRKASGTFDVIGAWRWTLIVGAEYQIGMVLDQPNNKVTVHCPDGTVCTLTDSRISTLDMRTARFQVTNGYPFKWGSVWLGKSKGDAFRALGGGAPMADIIDLRSVTRAISGGKTGAHATNCPLFTYTTPGPSSANRLKLSVDLTVLSSALPGVCFTSCNWEIPIKSNASANVLGTIDQTHYRADDASGITLSLGSSFALSGQTFSCGIIPYVGGVNWANVSGVQIDYRVEVLGNSGGYLAKV